jgi:hypothetical protein
LRKTLSEPERPKPLQAPTPSRAEAAVSLGIEADT